MKGSRDAHNKQSKQGFTKKPMPEIRDDLDSRKNEEYQRVDDMKKNKKFKKDKSEEHKRS
jgi:hypothetical protein